MSLLDNLISYWKCDEASGNLLDAHGSNNLTQNGTITSAAGVINTSREFDGNDANYFSHASNTDFQTGDIDFTWTCWVNIHVLGNERILIKGGTDFEYSLYFDGGAQRFYNYIASGAGGTGLSFIELTDALAFDTWHFIALWYDATANTLNIQGNNGTVYSTSHTGGAYVGTEDINFGRLIGGGQPVDGFIDEVGFWKRVLTSQERTDLYNSGAGLPYSSFGPVAGLPFITTLGAKRI
jgi:hypothetical protein